MPGYGYGYGSGHWPNSLRRSVRLVDLWAPMTLVAVIARHRSRRPAMARRKVPPTPGGGVGPNLTDVGGTLLPYG